MRGFQTFKNSANLSSEQICSEFLNANREQIRIKKDETAVRNLVRIFDSTLALSSSKGFQAMSVRDLAREANLSMGALYSYFKSKEELLAMIRSFGSRLMNTALSGEIRSDSAPGERLVQAIEAHLYMSEIMKPWFYFNYMEAKNLRREEQKKAIEMELYTEGIFVEIIKDGIAAGCFRAIEPTLTAAVLKAMLQDWYLKPWKYQKRAVSVEDYARFLIEMMDHFLKES
ncbi:MAG: TetR/AcrR family transcriptional regulator [Syntrophobacterales bacterium]|nr:TetR/AcrR family transcriptional regulator [Syntrophobacterales bacterium]